MLKTVAPVTMFLISFLFFYTIVLSSSIVPDRGIFKDFRFFFYLENAAGYVYRLFTALDVLLLDEGSRTEGHTMMDAR